MRADECDESHEVDPSQSFCSCQKRPRIASAVDQQVLAGDEAGVHRAQEGAIGAELGRTAIALGRIGAARARARPRSNVLPVAASMPRMCRALRVAVEDAGQQIVDGDVARDGLPRQPGDETDQARARAVRQAKLDLRDFHAARHDVDDAAEAARHHAVDREPHHLDRAEHHGVERGDPVVARPVAEIAGQRAVGVVEQDVGRGTGARARRRGPRRW